jgi:hypothetical protein
MDPMCLVPALVEATGTVCLTRTFCDVAPLVFLAIDRVDFNAATHGQRDLDDDRLSNLIEAISAKPLGLSDVEPDIIGRSYEYLIRKFAEGSGQSAGEFYTPREVGRQRAAVSRSPYWVTERRDAYRQEDSAQDTTLSGQ